AGEHAARHVALQERADRVVADAERLREDEPAQPDRETAEGGPPHPVDGKPAEGVFGGVHGEGEEGGEAAGQESHEEAAGEAPRADEERVGRRREERTEADDVAARRRGGGTRGG